MSRRVPDFQRHILPLYGPPGLQRPRLPRVVPGTGRLPALALRLRLQDGPRCADKRARSRVDLETAEGSKILQKPTLAIPHKGGKRLEEDTWQYRVLVRWIEAGAKGVEKPVAFERLEVTPTRDRLQSPGQQVPLQVIAHWADGTAEDVTCITRLPHQ